MEDTRAKRKRTEDPRINWSDNPEVVQKMKELYEEGGTPKTIALKLNLPANKVRAKIANMKSTGEISQGSIGLL